MIFSSFGIFDNVHDIHGIYYSVMDPKRKDVKIKLKSKYNNMMKKLNYDKSSSKIMDKHVVRKDEFKLFYSIAHQKGWLHTDKYIQDHANYRCDVYDYIPQCYGCGETIYYDAYYINCPHCHETYCGIPCLTPRIVTDDPLQRVICELFLEAKYEVYDDDRERIERYPCSNFELDYYSRDDRDVRDIINVLLDYIDELCKKSKSMDPRFGGILKEIINNEPKFVKKTLMKGIRCLYCYKSYLKAKEKEKQEKELTLQK